MESKKVILITQARMGSTRFPKKVLKTVNGKSILGLQLERIKESKNISKIIVATTFEDGVEDIIKIVKQENILVFQGDLNDVLDRFYQAAKTHNPDYVVRVTSDCPLIDAKLIDKVIELTINNNADYGSNTFIEEYPDGQDVEVFTFKALEQAWKDAEKKSDREHVTPYIRNNSSNNGGKLFNSIHLNLNENFNHIRMTVDEPNDLDCIETLVMNLGFNATWQEYTNFILKNKDKFNNQQIIRNEGYIKTLLNNY